jgi:6-phosphogluconolactonase
MADVLISATPEAVSERAAADLAAYIAATLAQKNRFHLALSGGSTPRKLYSLLTQDPYRKTIPWEKLWVFFSDERCVPPDHADSNYRMAKDALLDHVPIPRNQVFRMRGEDAPPQAGRDYEQVMREHFRVPSGFPRLDLILLGMGSDGHVASLFAGSPALSDGERWIVGNVVRSLQTVRITMTLPVINQGRHVWFLVTGPKKMAAFARARSGPDPACPASLVQPEEGVLRWYIDEAVAGTGRASAALPTVS